MLGLAACNKAEISTSGDGSSGSGELTDPNAVFQAARDGVANLQSAAYVADIEVTGVPDPAVTDDPTAQLAENLKIHAEGAFSKEGMAAQGTFDISVGGQTIKAEIKANESGVYVGLMGQWYQVPPEQTEEFKQYRDDVPGRHRRKARRQYRRSVERTHDGGRRDDRRRRVLPPRRQARPCPGRPAAGRCAQLP